MSWDIFVQEIPEDVKQISDMHEKYSKFKPSPIGMRSEIIKKIKKVVPEANFSDPSWGTIDGDGFSIEVNMGDKEECNGFAFHVGWGHLFCRVSRYLYHCELNDDGAHFGAVKGSGLATSL